MIYDCVYLFDFDTLEDHGCRWDKGYDTIEDAQYAALAKYGVALTGWQMILKPSNNCQQDWIAPVRVKSRDTGTPNGINLKSS